MTRSDWASTSKQVLLQFDYTEHHESSSDVIEATVRPASLYRELASTQHDPSFNSTFAALHIPKSAAKGSQKKRACLVLPVIQSDDGVDDDDGSNSDDPSITIPSSLCRHFDKRLFTDGSDIRLALLPHTPVKLSFVFLAATSKEGYEYSQHSQDTMERNLDGKLLRQDDILIFARYHFRIVMTEPVLQGIAVAASTQIFISLDQGDALNDGTLAEVLDDQSDEDFAIDERFLAKSVLDGFGSEDGEDTQQDGAEDGAKGAHGLFEAIPVRDQSFFNEAFSASLQRLSLESVNVDEEDSILLVESGLAALGAFEGDWAVVGIKGHSKSRVVRLFSAESQSRPSIPIAQLSPILLQNLHGRTSFDPTKAPKLISLQVIRQSRISPSNSGSALDCPLPIPFADSLTIARVAGPYSINRSYQSLFLSALRSHFEGKRRVIREGDIIAVGFDKGRVRWIRGENAGEEEEAEENAGGEVIDFDLPTSTKEILVNTAIVHFCVVSLTPELSEPEAEETSTESGLEDAALRESARVGDLGCVVDTTLTKIVQTGVVKMRVSDAIPWLQVESDTPRFTLHTPLCAPGSIFGRLSTLVEATLLPHSADYGLHLTVLLKGARGSGKKTYVRWVAQQAGVHLIELNCFDLIADTDARTEGMLRARFEQAASSAPAILLLQNIDALARKSQALETGQEPMMASVLQDCIRGLRDISTLTRTSMPVSVFGSTSSAEKCPTGILGCFKHEVILEAPSESERYAILELCLQDTTLSADVNLSHLATQTAALVACDLVDLVSRAQLACVDRIRALQDVSDSQIISAGMTLTGKDFEEALSQARLSYSETIGAPKIPNVTWDDVGGLASVKDDILDTIQLPLEHPELFTDGLKKRSGILLYGPPGTGKTLLAKAVATSCSLNFFSIKGPELLNMYIGESEANVRRVFQRARDAKPCVIFFDELDSIAPKRGNQGDSGGVMDRIVSQLLAELDGMSSSDGGGGEVFVIGATNRPDLLDPALLRPGRFDRMLYLSVSETHVDQLNILQALTRKFTLDEDVGDLSVIAEQCPFNLTGADFYALCSDAMLKSMTRKASSIDECIQILNKRSEEERNEGEKHPYPLTTQYYLNEMADPQSLEIQVSRKDFEEALKELIPSVSMQEMQHYRQVQAKFSSPPSEDKESSERGVAVNGNGSSIGNAIEDGNVSMAQLQELYRQATLSSSVNGSVMNGNGTSHPKAEESSEKPPATEQQQHSRRKNKGKGKARAD